MKNAIDCTQGQALVRQRMDAVEPVFGNLRHSKGLNRLALRGKTESIHRGTCIAGFTILRSWPSRVINAAQIGPQIGLKSI